MEVDYKKSDIDEYREFLTSIGEDEREYSDEKILRLLAEDV